MKGKITLNWRKEKANGKNYLKFNIKGSVLPPSREGCSLCYLED